MGNKYFDNPLYNFNSFYHLFKSDVNYTIEDYGEWVSTDNTHLEVLLKKRNTEDTLYFVVGYHANKDMSNPEEKCYSLSMDSAHWDSAQWFREEWEVISKIKQIMRKGAK